MGKGSGGSGAESARAEGGDAAAASTESGSRAPSRLRTFDPVRLGDLEYQAWVGYYRRRWLRVLAASVGLVRVGFGLSWEHTCYGAWLVLRANMLWAPYPDNDPVQAQACMRRFYTLVRAAHGEPADPALAAELEVDWWRVHRAGQHADGPGAPGAEPSGELVESLTRLYSHLYREPASAVRPAAVHRARAMDLSDEWVRQGCQPDSPLLPLEHAALVRCYAALLAAVHR
jgi:hypothetical protein